MLDRQFVRQNPPLVKVGAARKGIDAPVDEFLRIDGEWREAISRLEVDQAEMNRTSKSIGTLLASGKTEEAEAAKAKTSALKDSIRSGESAQRDLEAQLRAIELSLPNLPHASVPDGLTEAENVIVRTWGEPAMPSEPTPHWEIAEELGLLDLPRATKLSGSGFALYTGWGARLQRALFNFMIDHQTLKAGYREIYPPFMVNADSLRGTGQLPKFGDDLYKTQDDLYLIPTAEVPVTNMYRDEILDASALTMKMAAYSGCFRREAGAAGKDTRGIQRVHQFDKVELVKLTKPEDSYDELESLTKDAEAILQMMGLHYRVSLMCGGEMSFSNAKQYDLEIWSPGLQRYLEVSSCSNFEAFQARRAGIRFRRAQGERPEFVHTLNGSGVACPRLFACILEVHRQPDGSVLLPEPLRPYVGSDRLPRPSASS